MALLDRNGNPIVTDDVKAQVERQKLLLHKTLTLWQEEKVTLDESGTLLINIVMNTFNQEAGAKNVQARGQWLVQTLVEALSALVENKIVEDRIRAGLQAANMQQKPS